MPRPLDYIDVATRLAELRATYPELTLQQVRLEFVEVNGMSFVVYTAAAYRTPDDIRPGHGTAWEPIPGPTAFTRDSEVQNAETSAWGRALIAIGASTRAGIASAEEVENRSGNQTERQTAPRGPQNGPGAAVSVEGSVAPKAAKDGYTVSLVDVERITEAAERDPSNSFLVDIAAKFKQYRCLSKSQTENALKAANRILDQPRVLTPAGDEWPPDEERF